MSWKNGPVAGLNIIRNLSTGIIYKKSHYDSLGVQSNATHDEIKEAYFELTKKYHPDKTEATDENLAKFREISAAYDVLGNVKTRKMYDRSSGYDTSPEDVDETTTVEDPLGRFYRKSEALRHTEFRHGFDAWTKNQANTSRLRKKELKDMYAERAKLKAAESTQDERISRYFPILFGISIIGFFIVRLNSDPKYPNERRVGSTETKIGKMKSPSNNIKEKP